MKKLLFLLAFMLFVAFPGFAADSTSFDPTKVMVQSVATSSIPIGTVIAWPSASWPADADNWLECNGQAISSAVYPELVAVVGSRVPDYRGIFLRGQGSQVSSHYGTVTHSSAALGQLQGDSIREIWGEILTGAVEEGSKFSGAFRSAEIGKGGDGSGGDYGIYFRASWVTPVAQEVRPVNRAVRYLIRAK